MAILKIDHNCLWIDLMKNLKESDDKIEQI